MKKPTDTARTLAWVVGVLLLAPGAGRAADLSNSSCEKSPPAQQRGSQTAASPGRDGKPGDKGDKGSDHSGPPKWWIEPKLRAELNITDQQSALLEAIWQKSLPRRAESYEQQKKLEATLSQMILDAVDEATFVAQLDKVEAARSESSKARFLMLYRMNRILKPEQRLKLDAMAKAMREQRNDGRRGGSSSR